MLRRKLSDCPPDWPAELWRWRQRHAEHPWCQLSYLWEQYPPGTGIPAQLYARETELRKRVGLPPRSADLAADERGVLAAMGATGTLASGGSGEGR